VDGVDGVDSVDSVDIVDSVDSVDRSRTFPASHDSQDNHNRDGCATFKPAPLHHVPLHPVLQSHSCKKMYSFTVTGCKLFF
jgi:hypothetical protein